MPLLSVYSRAGLFALLTNNHLKDCISLCTLSRGQDQGVRQDDSATEAERVGVLQQRLSQRGGGREDEDVAEVQMGAIHRGSVTYLPGTF